MSWLNTITNALSIAAAAQDGNRSSSGGFPDLTLLVPIPQGDSLPARELVSEIVKRVFAAHGIHATDTELRQATGKLTPTLDFNGTRAGNFASVGDHPVHGGGKVHGYRFTITDELQRQVLAHAPAQNGTATSARETSRGGEVAMHGSQMRHKLEVAWRKQEALQQAAQDTGLAGAVTLAAQRTPNTVKNIAAQLPKVAPLVSELLPPVVATGIVAGGMALGLDKQLELMVERQMEMIKSAPPPIATSNTRDDASPVTTAERPPQPEIKVAPEGGELVKPDAAPPVTSAPTQAKPTTTNAPPHQPSAPQAQPPSGKPPLDLTRGIPTAITTAGLGKLAADTAKELQNLKVPQGLSETQFEQLSVQVRQAAGHYGTDIRVHGSRAAGTAKPDSDIDIAIRVSSERFDQIISERFKSPNPGSDKEERMQHAQQSGKIQRGELGLSGLGRLLEKQLGYKVDISVIREGGAFDKGPWTALKEEER